MHLDFDVHVAVSYLHLQCFMGDVFYVHISMLFRCVYLSISRL